MKRTALLVATLRAGLMAAPAIQSSPLTFFQQLFGVDSADVVTQKEGPMKKIKLEIGVATIPVAAGLFALFAINGCAVEPVRLDETIGRNPVVATAPEYESEPYSAAFAWQVLPEADAEDATEILVKRLPAGSMHSVPNIISPAAVSHHPVQLVQAGDRYFLAWIDDTEPPAKLRWRFLQASDLSQIGDDDEYIPEGAIPAGDGVYETGEYIVSEFVAAHSRHPDHDFILVAVLARQPLAPEDVEYSECVVDEISRCHLRYFTVNVSSGEMTDPVQIRGGPARALSIAAGDDGFFVAAAMSPVGYRDNPGNSVTIWPFDEAGGRLTTYEGFAVTGLSDCADNPSSVVESGDHIARGVGITKAESNYSETTIAYNSDNGRYLVGYTSACDNSYFRARWVEKEGNGWIIYGVAETAYTTAGADSSKIVTAPPFETMVGPFGSIFPSQKAMLTYNSSWHRYIAAFGSSWNLHALPEEFPDRENFLQTSFRGDVRNCFPARISQDQRDSAGTTLADFVSGSIVTDTEGDQRKTYYVWEQKEIYVPCSNPISEVGYCADDDLDFDDAEPSTEPRIYYGYLDTPPSFQTCEDFFHFFPEDPNRLDPRLDQIGEIIMPGRLNP